MQGSIYVVQGDLAQLDADALVYSTDLWGNAGQLDPSFREYVPGFGAGWDAARAERRLGQGGKLPIGHTEWVEVERRDPSAHRVRGVVVVVATSEGEYASCADLEQAAYESIREAWQRLAPQRGKRRVLVALPAMGVGAGGQRDNRVEAARAQFHGAGRALAECDRMDVAFVTYKPDTYRIFLQARRTEVGEPFPRLPMGLQQDLVRALRQQECVLFVGAGLSRGSGLPGWQSLIEELLDALTHRAAPADQGRLQEARKSLASGDTDALLEAAQVCRELGGEQVYRFLQERLDLDRLDARPSLAHYFLLSLPIRYYLTTNYDALLERTLEGLRRHPVRVVEQHEVACTGEREGVFVVKMHGDLTPERDRLVLGKSDYKAFSKERGAMRCLLEGLLLNHAFFFVGYSLEDPNFREMYDRVDELLRGARRRVFATSFDSRKAQPGEWWQDRQLELQIVPNSGEEQTRHWLAYLDQLSEEAADLPDLFLASDAAPTAAAPEPGASLPALVKLRETLLAAGKYLEEILRQEQLAPEAVPAIAQTLQALVDQGWRPQSGSLARLYEHLARHSQGGERARFAAAALRYAESLEEVRRIQALLGQRDQLLHAPHPLATRRPPAAARPSNGQVIWSEVGERDRITGALLAFACGDALGAPYEGQPRAVLAAWGLQPQLTGQSAQPNHQPWGGWNDDTAQTLCVAEGILEHPADPILSIGRRFLGWRPRARSIGATTAAALGGFTASWPAAARNTPPARHGRAAGSGSLLRALPIALAYADRRQMLPISARVSGMTHWDPQAEVCCAVYCLWVGGILRGKRPDEAWQAAVPRAQRSVTRLGRLPDTPGPAPLPSDFWDRLTTAPERTVEELQPSGYAGYVVDCLEAAVWCALHATSVKEALVTAVRLGGDTDTIAALTGGAVGAATGAAGMPDEWLTALPGAGDLPVVATQLAELRVGS